LRSAARFDTPTPRGVMPLTVQPALPCSARNPGEQLMPQIILPRRCAGRSLQIVSRRVVLSCTAFTLMLFAHLPAAVAVTVSWNVDSDGFWDVAGNWSTG